MAAIQRGAADPGALVDSSEARGPRNITLVISSLSMGGAERMMSTLAGYWATHGKKVTLITLAAESTDFWKIDPGIARVALNLIGESSNPVRAIVSNLYRIFRLRKAIRASKPDVVLSFLETPNILALIACRGFSIPVLVAERCDAARLPPEQPWSILRRWSYPLAYRVIVQTERAKIALLNELGARTVVIPNPVTEPAYDSPESQDMREHLGSESPDIRDHPGSVSQDMRDHPGSVRPRVAAVGRLQKQKRFDLLLRAFAIVKDRHPEWRLDILGEGSLRTELEALRDELGLKDRLGLPGRISNVPAALRESDLFVLSSDYEGFPNALCEAMACGLAVIATDCPSGPREIIRDGVDGLLTPPGDVETLAAAMDRLMSSDEVRERLGRRAVEVLERFGLEKVMGMWDDLFVEAAGSPRTGT
ncbi:MAG TPA: glycosyltransferase family 4 protein [Armatimonadota bacterium]|nr:glycosyltransferase family 4 protein [Armatimonadota bacterium]